MKSSGGTDDTKKNGAGSQFAGVISLPYSKLAERFTPRATGELRTSIDLSANYKPPEKYHVPTKRGSMDNVSTGSPYSEEAWEILEMEEDEHHHQMNSNAMKNDGLAATTDLNLGAAHDAPIYSSKFTYASAHKIKGAPASKPFGLGASFVVPKNRNTSNGFASTDGFILQDLHRASASTSTANVASKQRPPSKNVVTPKASAGFDEHGEPIFIRNVSGVSAPKPSRLGDSSIISANRKSNDSFASTDGFTLQDLHGGRANTATANATPKQKYPSNNVVSPKASAGLDEKGEPISIRNFTLPTTLRQQSKDYASKAVITPKASAGFNENGEPVAFRKHSSSAATPKKNSEFDFAEHKQEPTEQENSQKPQRGDTLISQRKNVQHVTSPKASVGFDERGEPIPQRKSSSGPPRVSKAKSSASVITSRLSSGYDENGEPIALTGRGSYHRRSSTSSKTSISEPQKIAENAMDKEGEPIVKDVKTSASTGDSIPRRSNVLAPKLSRGISENTISTSSNDSDAPRRESALEKRSPFAEVIQTAQVVSNTSQFAEKMVGMDTHSSSNSSSIKPVVSGSSTESSIFRSGSQTPAALLLRTTVSEPEEIIVSNRPDARKVELLSLDARLKKKLPSINRSKTSALTQEPQDANQALPANGKSSVGSFKFSDLNPEFKMEPALSVDSDRVAQPLQSPTSQSKKTVSPTLAAARASEKRKRSPTNQSSPDLASGDRTKKIPESAKIARSPSPIDFQHLGPTKELPPHSSPSTATSPTSPKKKLRSLVGVPLKIPENDISMQISPRIMSNEESIAKERRRTDSLAAKTKIKEIMKSDEKSDMPSPHSEQEKQSIASNVRRSLFMNKIDYSTKTGFVRSPTNIVIPKVDRSNISQASSATDWVKASEQNQLSKAWIKPVEDNSLLNPEEDKLAKMIMAIRQRQIAEQPVPKKLDPTILKGIQSKFEEINTTKASSDREHLGRPIQKINNQLKLSLEEKFLKIVEGKEKRISMEMKLEGAQKNLPKLKYQSVKSANSIVERIEDKVSKSRLKRSEGGESRPSVEDNPISVTRESKDIQDGHPQTETKVYPEIEVVIDSILDNSPLITEFSFDSHPFFLSVPGKDNLHKTMSRLFAEALAFNTYLKSISLQTCGLGDVFLNELCNHMQKGSMRNVEEFNMKGNAFSSSSIMAFVKCLTIGFSSETEEDTKITDEPLKLRKVNVSGQILPISAEAEELIAKALMRNTKIIDFPVKVSSNDVRQLIKKFTARNRALMNGGANADEKHLTPVEERIRAIVLNADDDDDFFEVEDDFTFKVLGNKSQIVLAKALRTNTKLKSLKLVKVDLGDEFACCLAESLIDNKVLEFLDLRNNKISSKGILAIAECLRLNDSLKNVNLDGQNPPLILHTDLENELVQKLDSNTSLVKLSLKLKDPTAAAALEKLINRNCLSQLQSWGKKSRC